MTKAPSMPWLQETIDEWLLSTPAGQIPPPQSLVARLGLAAARQKAENEEMRQCHTPLDQIRQCRQEEEKLRQQLKLPAPQAADELSSVPPGQRLAAVNRLLGQRQNTLSRLQEVLALQSRVRQVFLKAKQRLEKNGSDEERATLDNLHAALLSDNLSSLILLENWSDYSLIIEAFIDELKTLAPESAPDIRVVFGLPPEANEKQIKSRYRELAFQFHPDRNGQHSPQERARREEDFKRIQAAWDAYQNSPT